MGDHGGTLSWSLGPAESRLVRRLYYLFSSLVFGAGFYLVGEVILWAVTTITSGLIGVAFVGLIAVFLALLVRDAAIVRSAFAWAEDHPESAIQQEWIETVRWPVVALGGGLVAVVLGAIHLWVWGTDWLVATPSALVTGAILLGVVVLIVIFVLSSTGQFDPEQRKLSYNGRHELDVTLLVAAQRITVGERTYLWVTLDADHKPSVPRLYLLPTAVADQVWPVIQPHLETGPTDEDAAQTVSRETSLAIVLLLGIGLATVLVLALAGVPLDMALWPGAYFAFAALAAFLAKIFGS